MRVLGIETSCDETGIGLVEDGRRLLAHTIASQVDLHARFGGVVPEVASRQHLLALIPTLRRTLDQAGLTLRDVEAIGVVHGPGLIGSLMVGVNFAKGLAMALGVPLVGVNHLEAHIYAMWLEEGPPPDEEPGFPLVCLLVSGGHTDLVLMEDHGRYRLLGRTRDDAAGEAFDKVARVLGLGFPGGPEVQRVAGSARQPEDLPRPRLSGSWDFSFSGLKTAVVRRAQAQGLYPEPAERDPEAVANLASGFQSAVADVLVEKTLEAVSATGARGVLVAGGVAANALLRQRFRERSPVPVLIPRPSLCTDNGAMVASCAWFLLQRGQTAGPDLDANPSLALGGMG